MFLSSPPKKVTYAPPKTKMEPKNGGSVWKMIFPFEQGWLSGSLLFFGSDHAKPSPTTSPSKIWICPPPPATHRYCTAIRRIIRPPWHIWQGRRYSKTNQFSLETWSADQSKTLVIYKKHNQTSPWQYYLLALGYHLYECRWLKYQIGWGKFLSFFEELWTNCEKNII